MNEKGSVIDPAAIAKILKANKITAAPKGWPLYGEKKPSDGVGEPAQKPQEVKCSHCNTDRHIVIKTKRSDPKYRKYYCKGCGKRWDVT